MKSSQQILNEIEEASLEDLCDLMKIVKDHIHSQISSKWIDEYKIISGVPAKLIPAGDPPEVGDYAWNEEANKWQIVTIPSMWTASGQRIEGTVFARPI